MHGRLARFLGEYSEELFFQGEQSRLNPMRYLPTPFHTKFAQQRTALSQYIQQESVGTRMRRWERPIHDMLAPWFRGLVERATGIAVIPEDVQRRRDLDTLSDMLQFLRAETEAGESSKHVVPLPSLPGLPAFHSAPALPPSRSGNSRAFSRIGGIPRHRFRPPAAHRPGTS
jgi:hypothetical protein